jgi:hypothetical protein
LPTLQFLKEAFFPIACQDPVRPTFPQKAVPQ